MNNLILELAKIVIPAVSTIFLAFLKKRKDIKDLRSGKKNLNDL